MALRGLARLATCFVISVLLFCLPGCNSGGTITPLNQPQVTNATNDFQFQATNLSNVTQTIQYTWQNTGTQASVNQATVITAGSATLRIRDASGTQVYTNSLTVNGTQLTSVGATGNWTIEVVLTGVSGTINFRVQKNP